MQDLILWFTDNFVEILTIQAVKKKIDLETIARFDKSVLIKEDGLYLSKISGSDAETQPENAATAIRWPDFLEGLSLVPELKYQVKIAEAFFSKVRNKTKDFEKFSDRIWLILPPNLKTGCENALRSAIHKIVPGAKAIHLLLLDLVLALGISDILSHEAKKQRASFVTFMMSARDKKLLRALNVIIEFLKDSIKVRILGWKNLDKKNEFWGKSEWEAIEVVFADDSEAVRLILNEMSTKDLPEIRYLSTEDIAFAGLKVLINPKKSHSFVFSTARLMGFGLPDGVHIPVGGVSDIAAEEDDNSFTLFEISEDEPESELSLALYQNCLGGMDVGRELGRFTIPQNRIMTAHSKQLERSLLGLYLNSQNNAKGSGFLLSISDPDTKKRIDETEFKFSGLVY